MIHFSVRDPVSAHLLGATRGQQTIGPLLAQISHRPNEELIVVLDFTGVEAANASFLKATAFHLFLCGRLFANSSSRPVTNESEFSPKPFNVFPVFANLGPDVADEMTEVFQGRGFPFVEALSWSDDLLNQMRVRGHIEPAMREAILVLDGKKDVTATELSRGTQSPSIAPTAWNNRLADLNLNRLARRRRQGKHWHYSLIAERTQLWACGT